MSTTLGTLIVRLGLDAAEFTTGLTKSERDAQKFAQALDRGIAAGAKAAGIALAAVGTAAIAALSAIDQLAKQAGDFQDLAEMTGASAEGLASFAVAAGVAGTEMSTIADASVKLTKSLTGVDDESKAAGAALAAMGLNIKEFKALAPEEQIDAVAKALAGFEDGASKTAVAVALFGKAGAQLLPFLKELAAEGGRQVILTRQQIELADAYADAQAKARTELNLYAQVAATQALPAITAVVGAAKELIGELIGLDSAGKTLRDSDAIRTFAENAARTLGFLVDAGDGVIRIFQGVGLALGAGMAARAAALEGNFKGARAVIGEFQSDLDKLITKQLFSARVEKQITDARRNDALRRQEDRGFTPQGNVLKFTGAVTAPKGGGDQASEAQRYLDNLQKQIDRTLELTAVQQAQQDVSKLKGMTDEIYNQIIAVAAQIDAYKELDKWLKESGKEFDEQVKKQRELLDAQAKATNSALDRAKAAQDNNERLRDEIAITLGGVEAQKALAKAYADSAVAEAEKDRLMRASLGASEAELQAIDATIDALKEYRELLDGKDLAEKLAKDAQALQDVKNMISDDFADAFSSVIDGTKDVKSAFDDLAKTILQQISRIAAQNIANAIFGGNNSGGPDVFAVIGKLIGLFAGAGGGAGSAYTGAYFGTAANGTNFAVGGPTLVGERGPEVVDLPRGARVTPNGRKNASGGGGTTNMTQVINVPARADSRTVRQMAKEGYRAAAGQARRG